MTKKQTTPLDIVNGSKSIEEIVKHHNIILSHTKKFITKHHSETEDLIQDVYINIIEWIKKNPTKTITSGFLHICISRTWINKQKKKNIKMNYDFDTNLVVELEDEDYDLNNKIDDEYLYDLLEQRISKLHWYEQKLLQYSLKMSIKEISKRSNISYTSLRETFKEIKIKLKDG